MRFVSYWTAWATVVIIGGTSLVCANQHIVLHMPSWILVVFFVGAGISAFGFD